MAHTKTGAAVKGSRKAVSKRLGVKRYAGEKVIPGNIIVRQKGTKIKPGNGTYMGKDFTIMAEISGIVNFNKNQGDIFVNVKA